MQPVPSANDRCVDKMMRANKLTRTIWLMSAHHDSFPSRKVIHGHILSRVKFLFLLVSEVLRIVPSSNFLISVLESILV